MRWHLDSGSARSLLQRFLVFVAAIHLSMAADAAGPPQDLTATANTMQRERLRRHSFVSETVDTKAPGLLLGNTNLGGCLAASGLGIPRLWGAALWNNPGQRLAVKGPLLSCGTFADLTGSACRQELSLLDGVARTTVRRGPKDGYDAEVFCSMADTASVVLRVTNRGDHETEWSLDLPTVAHLEPRAPDTLTGTSADGVFSSLRWSLRSDLPITRTDDSRCMFHLPPTRSATFVFRLETGDDVSREDAALTASVDFARMLDAHRSAWTSLWDQCAVLALPDAELERLWYRSLYWTLSTCGDGRYLPGESMFAVPCWDMHPFTYGAAGWAVQAFTSVGLPERAKAMLAAHLRPDALRENARYYASALGGENPSNNAMAFAHEVRIDGHRIPCGQYELQRQLDAFAVALFYRHQRFYPGQGVPPAEFYSLLCGVADFWCAIVRQNPSGEFLLPNMTSLTEDLIAPHPIDAALAAKWCLMMAHRQAVALGRDPEQAAKWKNVADHLAMPQNDQRYLEFANDPDQRGGGGYQGVRGFVYLAYPTIELIPSVDRAKALRTLDHTWTRNRKGEGMIGFVANWFALADLHFGRGDHALEILRHNLRCEDAWGQGVSECPGNRNYHFATNYSSYLLVPLAMAVQSADDRIEVCHGVPSGWKDFAFYRVPAEAGIRVSGEMRDGKLSWINCTRNHQPLFQTTRTGSLRIVRHHDGLGIVENPAGGNGKPEQAELREP